MGYSNDRLKGIEVGDTIRIVHLMVGRMYIATPCSWSIGRLAIVTSIKPYQYLSSTSHYSSSVGIRILDTDVPYNEFDIDDHKYETIELVSKGDGRAVGGIHYNFTEAELKDQRFEAFRYKCSQHDFTYEGFSNAATYLAWLYLNNCNTFIIRDRTQMARKDGTLNPGKIHKYFYAAGLSVDDWALECPLDTPEEFKHYNNREYIPTVNWAEVALNFANKRVQ